MPVNRRIMKPKVEHYFKFRVGRQDMFYVGKPGDQEKDWSPDKADARIFEDIREATEVCEKVAANGATIALKMMAKKHQRMRPDR